MVEPNRNESSIGYRTLRALPILFVAVWASEARAQSEEKTFKSAVAHESRADACMSAKQAAQQWLQENTDRSHRFHQVNQLRRGWVAKSDGTRECDCSKTDNRFQCTVDARISAVK